VTDLDPTQPTLPGLDEDAPNAGDRDRLLVEVRSTLRQYRDAGLVTNRDAAKVALCEELATIIGIKRRGGRLSTVSNDARLLGELLDSFVGEGQAVDEKLAEAMAAWQVQVDRERAG
jgi:hypothetical protein